MGLRESRLARAAERGQVAKVRKLIEQGADVNARGRAQKVEDANFEWWLPAGRTPLYLAAQNGHVEVVQLLLDRGADPNLGDEYGETPLHQAARRAECEIGELLLKAGADANARMVLMPFNVADVGDFGPVHSEETPLRTLEGSGLSLDRAEKGKMRRLLKRHGGEV